MLRFKRFIGKLQRGLPVSSFQRPALGGVKYDEEFEAKNKVASDVKNGHFMVVAIRGDDTEKFTVPLSYLTDPAFLKLLELAKDEFGFRQKGALVVPCQPAELKNILDASKGNCTGVKRWL